MTPLIFIKHGGTLLKKFAGLAHTEVKFDKQYNYIEIPGIVTYDSANSDPEDRRLTIISPPKMDLSRRAMVEINPEMNLVGSFNSQRILEPGESPAVYLRDMDGYFHEQGLDWVFRIYFIK